MIVYHVFTGVLAVLTEIRVLVFKEIIDRVFLVIVLVKMGIMI